MTISPISLAGKTALVFGVANKRSIAWAIAQAWAEAGAKLIFNYQGERLKDNVEELAATFGPDTPLFPCHDFGDPCWTVLHVRSGRPFPFCWDSQGAALEMAEQCAEFGPWQDGEDAAVQRMKEHRKAVSRLAYDLGGRIHDFPAPSRGGIDNGAVA